MPFQSVEASGPHRPTEPEVYVKIHPRGLSCEIPPHHLPALLRQFALDLHAKKITLRLQEAGRDEASLLAEAAPEEIQVLAGKEDTTSWYGNGLCAA